MRKTAIFTALAGWCAGAGFCGDASVAAVMASDAPPFQQALDGFSETVKKGGVSLKLSKYALKDAASEDVLSKIKSERPDIVLAMGSKALETARREIKNVPVLVLMVMDPRAITGENVFGVSLDIRPELKVEEARRIFGRSKRIGTVYSAKTAPDYARAFPAELKVVKRTVGSEAELMDAFRRISGEIDFFLMLPDPAIYSANSIKQLMMESMRSRIPVIGLSSSYVSAGAVLSLDCDYADLGRQAGEMALEIFGGGEPGDRVQAPRKIRFSLNAVTAKLCGLEIPKAAAAEAAEVFTGE